MPSPLAHPQLRTIIGDVRDRAFLAAEFQRNRFEVVFHCAAMLAHGTVSESEMWACNVTGTETLAQATKAARIPVLVYTSSNCLWGKEFPRPIREDDLPCPAELYGLSKWEGEKILLRFSDDFATVIIRCPTIIDEGRLGLLSILFEFIREGRRVWVVGDGSNRYQFIYAQDLIGGMLMGWHRGKEAVFGIGSDNVRSLAETYEYVINAVNSRSKITKVPRWPAITAMKLAHQLRLSPLGPYHYQMIASNFCFDTTKIKAELNWEPTLSNDEMLLRAYLYFISNLEDIQGRTTVSSHRKPADMGIIKLLKWLS
jgi:nucleoside-diphosphate-sugar epimerase